jgi:CheY-like chemotaxis protein
MYQHKIDAIIKRENSRLGLEMLQRTEGAKIIILLDINMPVLDGWGFLEEKKIISIIYKTL